VRPPVPGVVPSTATAAALEARAALRGDGILRPVAAATTALLLALAGVRRTSQGPVPVTSAVDLLLVVVVVTAPAAVTAVAVARLVERRRRGVDRDLSLAGWPPHLRALAGVVDGLGLSLVLVVSGTVSIGLMTGDAMPSDLARLIIGILLAGCAWTGLGLALAVLTPDRTTGLGAVVAGHVVGLLLWWSAPVLPVSACLEKVWPWTAPLMLFVDRDGAWSVGAATSLLVLGAGWALACGRARIVRWRPGEWGPSTVTARRVPEALGGARGAVVGLVVALVVGVLAPSQLRLWLPWYLRPAWLAQVEAGRTSPEVARAWAGSVRMGGPVRTDLTSRRFQDPVPQLVNELLTRDFASAEVVDMADPAVVSISDANGATLYVCLHESGTAWKVDRLRTQPDCGERR
jgi:hypothetical protein